MPLTKLHKFIIKYTLLEEKNSALEYETPSRAIFGFTRYLL
jgi:hypothetical protein